MKARLVSVLFAAVMAFVPAAHGEDAKPQEVRAGIFILDLGRLDMATGSFSVDMYLSLKSDTPIPDGAFEFMNGRASTFDKLIDTPTEKFYRIMASLSTPMNLHKFPFDEQQMRIVLEDKTRPISQVRFVPLPKESGIDKGISFPGWQVVGSRIEVSEHEYPVYNETYSQLVFSVDIGRIRLNAFLKTFLPVLFLMLIVMSSFILNPEQITTRLAAISSSLVASAMFHISIAGQIPPVGYLTFADKFMFLTYMILLGAFGLSIAEFVMQGKTERKAAAAKLHKASEIVVLVGMPVLYAALFLFIE